MSTRMFQRIAAGELAVGSMVLTNGPEWVELLGYVGMDAICIDMMCSAIDWLPAADMVRAANRFNVTPWVRIPSYPWNRKTPYIPTADVVRALAIGAECVTVSLDSPEEVEQILDPASDHHRRLYIQGWEYDEWLQGKADVSKETLIIPLLESLGAAKKMDEILSVKGLRAVWLGVADLGALMGHAGHPEHPEMREFIKSVVDRGKRNGVMVFVNVGRRFDPAPMIDQAEWLWSIGVKYVFLTYPTYVAQRWYENSIGALRAKVGGGPR